MKLTTLTVSTAFILIVATLLNIGELYSMAGMLAALPLVCYFVGRRQNRGVQAERTLETVGLPGRSLQVTLKLKNQDSWPKRNLLIQDHLPRWLQRDRDARPILAPLPGGGTETVTYHLRPEKRGCYDVGPLEVVATDPLGIFQFRHEIAGTSELLVYPTTVDLPWIFPPGGSPYGASSLHTAEMRGEGSEFYGIREYQPGDPLRRVHWRSSARTGRLAVVEYEHDVSVDLTLVLDARRGSVVGSGTESTLEAAVTVTASLARLVLERGNRCRLAIPGVPVPRLADSRGVDALYGILEALARVEAEQSETAADAVAALLPELERHTTLTLITSVWDDASARAVTAAINAGIGVMVVYVDPDSYREAAMHRPAADPPEPAGLTPSSGGVAPAGANGALRPPPPRSAGSAAEAVRTQILALQARPVILHHGEDLVDQFALAAIGRT
jgi:uncharacterized protein (DUF58 family)